jgi:RNA polymerase sigma-70 factor (ECF subfamily)
MPDGRPDDSVRERGNTDLARVVADYHAVVYRYAFRLTGRVPDAEDLTQQTFLTAVRKLDQLRQADRVGSWLLAVVRNAYLKQSSRRQPVPVTSLGVDVERITWVEPPQTDLDFEQLQPALDELPDEFKVVVLMFYFEQYSYKEIASALELPIGTVMSRLSRAKSHLRARLASTEAADPPQKPPRTPKKAVNLS